MVRNNGEDEAQGNEKQTFLFQGNQEKGGESSTRERLQKRGSMARNTDFLTAQYCCSLNVEFLKESL